MRKILSIMLYVMLVLLLGNTEEKMIAAEGDAVIPSDCSAYVALTFDDGPNRATTERLLDALQSRGAKGTFFLIGENIDGNEDLVRRMADEGHQIGNHTWEHIRLPGGGSAGKTSLQKTENLLESITGDSNFWIRPPYGFQNDAVRSMVDVPLILWSVDPRDWESRNTDQVVREVMSEVQPNSIILLHDIYPTSVDAAIEIIDRLQEEGYCFVTVKELLALNDIQPEAEKVYRSA